MQGEAFAAIGINTVGNKLVIRADTHCAEAEIILVCSQRILIKQGNPIPWVYLFVLMTPCCAIPAPILIALVKAPLIVIAIVEVRHAFVAVALAVFEFLEQGIHQLLLRCHVLLEVRILGL